MPVYLQDEDKRRKVQQIKGETQPQTPAVSEPKTAASSAGTTQPVRAGMPKVQTERNISAAPAYLQYQSGIHADSGGLHRKINYDFDKMTWDDVYYEAANRLRSDEERDAMVLAYQEHVGGRKQLDTLRAGVDSKKSGGAYASTKAATKAALTQERMEINDKITEKRNEQRAAQHNTITSLNNLGIIGFDGSAINWNTISFEDAVRTVRLIPDDKARKAALKGIKAMTEDGGRFASHKAYDLTDSANGYIANSDFDQKKYKAFFDGDSDGITKGVRGSFSASAGDSAENRALYEGYLAKIEESDMTDYQKYWYKRGLDEVYKETTGVAYADKAADPEIATDIAQDGTTHVDETAEGEEAAKEPEKPSASVWQVLFPKREGTTRQKEDAQAFIDGLTKDNEPEEDAPEAPSPSVEAMHAPTPTATPAPVEGVDYARIGDYASATASTEGRWVSGRLAKAQEQTPQPLQPPMQVQGPQMPQQKEAPEEAPEEAPQAVYGTVNLADDPVRAAEYALSGRGNELDQETQTMLSNLCNSSQAARWLLQGWHYDIQSIARGESVDAQRYQNMGNTGRFAEDDIGYLIGGRLGGYYNKTRNDSFPPELTTDVIGMILGVAMDAETAYENGRFTYDPLNETLYDGYLRENPQELANLDGAFRTIYEMKKEKREQDQLVADAAEATRQEQIISAQAAVRSGSYTQDQYDLVVENAPVVTDMDLKLDDAYVDYHAEILSFVSEGYLDPDSWINQEIVSAGFTDLNTIVALDYLDVLTDGIVDQMHNDLRVAKALGYNGLEDYYARQGGFSVERIADRAKIALQQFDAEIDDDTLATAQMYTGGNDSTLEAVVGGSATGVLETSADYLEAIWTLDNARREDRPIFEQRMRNKYQTEYGISLSSYMYTQDMLAFADAHPNAEIGKYIKEYIASGADVFRLAIEPEMTWSLEAASAMNAKANALEGWAMNNLTQNAGKWFGRSRAAGSNALMQTVASLTTLATGSSSLGVAVGFGLPTIQQETEAQLAEGQSLKYGATMGIAKAVNTVLAESATSGKLTDKLASLTGINVLVETAGNVVTKSKTMNAMLGLLKSAGGQLFDELVVDEIKEGTGWQLIGKFSEEMMSGSGLITSILSGVRNLDVDQVLSDVSANMTEGFWTMLPNVFISGAGGAMEGWTATRKAAQEMAQTGSTESAQKFVESFVQEVQDEGNRAELDEVCEAASLATETVGRMMTDPEITPTVETAMAETEQANAHAQEAASSQARMDADMQTMQEAQARMDAGEINQDLPAVIGSAASDYSKANQGKVEHTREEAQKRSDADRHMGEAFAAAKTKAGKTHEAEKMTLKEQLAAKNYDGMIAVRDQIQSRIDKIWSTMENYSDELDNVSLEQADADLIQAEADLARINEQIAQAETRVAPEYIQQRQAARDAEDDLNAAADEFVQDRYGEADEEGQAAVHDAYIANAQQAAQEAQAEQTAQDAENPAAEAKETPTVTKEMFDFASRVQRKFGIRIRFVDDIAHGAGGSYENGVITIPKSASRSEVLRRVTTQGLRHYAETSGYYKELAASLKDIQYGGDAQRMQADLRAIINTYSPVYKNEGRTFTEADAERELVAKLNEQILGGNEEIINRIVGEKPSLARRIYEGIRQIMDRLRGNRDPEMVKLQRAARLFERALRSVPGNQIGTQYALSIGSHYDYSKPFAEQVDDWISGIIPKQDTLLLGGTPDILKKIGFSNLPITIDQSHMRKMLGDPQKGGKPKNDDHNLGVDFVKSLYERIRNPVAVIQNRTNSDSSVLVIFADKNVNADNRPIIGAVSVTTGGKINGITIDSTHLSTVHSRGNLLQLIEDAVDKQHNGEVGVFYVNKKSLSLLEPNQSQVLGTLNGDGLLQSIHDAGSTVKSQYIEQIETKQFKHWFGKSKVVDDAGQPLIVYHGSDAEFDVFDMSKGRANMDIQGAFFSPYEEDAAGYGSNVRAFYLSIQNPANESTAYRALNRFKGQNNAGIKARQYLQSLGYDGVYNGYDEYIAFSPEQIKSADKNVGLFDPQNPNVRYSLPSRDTLDAEIRAYQTEMANRPVTNEIGTETAQDGRNLGERQFATKTVQESPAMPQWLKDFMMTDNEQRYYERDTNDAQLMRAWGRIQRDGYDATRNRLKAQDTIVTADDVADAYVIAAMARRDDDPGTFLDISIKLNKSGTVVSQGFQARKLIQRMTPLGMQTWAAGQTERQLDEYRRTHKAVDEEVKREAKKVADKIKDLRGGNELLRLNAGGSVTVDASNSKWGVPINPQQAELIKQYELENVRRPGDHYNWATRKQRMLEAILQTPNPLEMTGNGLNLIQRLEFIKRGQACFTNADLNYIGHWMSVFAHSPIDDQESRIGDIALSRVYEAYGNITEAGWGEKAQTWRYTSMLISVPSAMRNVVGNATMNVINDAANDLAAVLDMAISAATGSERTRALISIRDRIDGWKAFVAETGNTFRDYFIDKTITQHGSDRFSLNQRGRVYQTEGLEAIRRMEGLLMSVGDRNYWRRAYLNSMNEQMQVARLNGTELDFETARENAENAANYAVFNEDNAVRTALSSMKQNGPPEVRFMLNMIMPFTGVPTNIAARVYQYSPAGLARTVIQTAADAINGRDFDQQRFVTNLARSGIGTGLLYAGMQLVQAGLFGFAMGTGAKDDDGVYAIESAQGKQYGPYIRIGDQYVQLNILSPAIMPLLMGAAAQEALNAEGSEEMAEVAKNAALAAFDTYFSSTFLTGIQDVFGGYGSVGENLLETVANNAVSQNVPALLTQWADAMDPYVRDTKDKNFIMQVVKTGIIARVPGWRETLPIKTDVTGAAIESKSAVQAFFDPTTRKAANDDATLQGLLDLADRVGETGFLPSMFIGSNSHSTTILKSVANAAGMLNGQSKKIELTSEEKAEANRLYGDILFNGTGDTDYYMPDGRKLTIEVPGIRAVMASDLTDAEKMDRIKNMKSAVKQLVQFQILGWYKAKEENE